MFDIAWSELAVIGAVALVVIGPKDLPRVMRTMGQWSRKVKLLASEFQRNVDDMVQQAEIDEMRKKAEAAFDLSKEAREMEEAVNASEIKRAFEEPSDEPRIHPLPAATPAPVTFEQPAPTADPLVSDGMIPPMPETFLEATETPEPVPVATPVPTPPPESHA